MPLLLFPQQPPPPQFFAAAAAAAMDVPNNDVQARQQHARCIMNLSTLLSSLVALYDRLYPDAALPPIEASSSSVGATADVAAGETAVGAIEIPPPSQETMMLRARLVVLKRCIEQVEEQIRRLVQEMPPLEDDRSRLSR